MKDSMYEVLKAYQKGNSQCLDCNKNESVISCPICEKSLCLECCIKH